jgi:hypothetical protein
MSYFLSSHHYHHCPPELSYLLWAIPYLRLPYRDFYIAGWHANRASHCSWKPAHPWPFSSGRGDHLIPGSALNSDHTSCSQGWSCFSLLLFSKVIYEEQEIKSIWVDKSERNSSYVIVSWPVFCVIAGVQCEVQLVESGEVWWSLGVPWGSPVQTMD